MISRQTDALADPGKVHAESTSFQPGKEKEADEDNWLITAIRMHIEYGFASLLHFPHKPAFGTHQRKTLLTESHLCDHSTLGLFFDHSSRTCIECGPITLLAE